MDHLNYSIPQSSSRFNKQLRSMGLHISSCRGKQYYVGLLHDNYHALFRGGFYNQYTKYWTPMGEQIIDIANIDPDIYYTIHITIERLNTTALHFHSSFNGMIQFSRIIVDNDDILGINNNGHSGYIAIYSEHVDVEFKSL